LGPIPNPQSPIPIFSCNAFIFILNVLIYGKNN
jgi:hypothetical protein